MTHASPGRAHPARPGLPSSLAGAAQAVAAVATLSCLGLAAAACDRTAPPSPPPVATAGPEAPLPPGVAEALTAPTAIPPAPSAAAQIPFVLRPAAAPPTGEPVLGAGAWSPDGRLVIAYTREVGAVDAVIGRLWVVDAGPPLDATAPAGGAPADVAPPRWALDSGDVVGAPGAAPLGAWRADGRLVVARSPDGLLDPGGRRPGTAGEAGGAASAAFPDLAPRSVAAAPGGATTLVSDDQRGWLVDESGTPRPVQGYPAGQPAAEWSWRGDGALAAAVSPIGAVWILDAAASAARQMSQLTWAPDTRSSTAPAAVDAADDGPAGSPVAPTAAAGAAAATAAARPIWLADGRLLVPRPARLSLDGGPVDDLPLVDPATGALDGVGALAQLPPYPTAPPSGLEWATTRGGWLLAPRVVLEGGAAALGPSRLVRLDGAEHRDIQPIAAPRWAPDGGAIAYVEAGALLVYDIASGGTRRLVDGGVRAAWWSPDGARLALAVDGGLVVVARDGAAGPTHVAEGLDPSLPPTWSPDGRRLAVVLADAAGRGGLVIVDVDG